MSEAWLGQSAPVTMSSKREAWQVWTDRDGVVRTCAEDHKPVDDLDGDGEYRETVALKPGERKPQGDGA